jgi:hypothetical protein
MDRAMTELARTRARRKYMCSRERVKRIKKKNDVRPIRVYLIGAAGPIHRARARLREKPKIDNPYCTRGSPKCEIDNVSVELWKYMCLSEN